MSKRKLILFSPELPNCSGHDTIFREYETLIGRTEEEFLDYLHDDPADAAVICFCSAREEDVEKVLLLEALTGPMPVLTCSKILNPEFIRKAARRGASRFITCDMAADKIRDIIHDAIGSQGLAEYLESRWPESLDTSPYIVKLIDEIVRFFPHRMKVEEYAERLGIDRGWLYKLCEEAFGVPLTALLRIIWLHQALRMMQHTTLDNMEIALQLDYSEESSMAREFRKELECNPNEARKRLAEQSPEELLP
jgi:AraC-like DNA-binding protein